MRDIDFQIGVENRDYHHLSQVEAVPNLLHGKLWAWASVSSIPVGIRADFAIKKNSKRKKYGRKKFLWLTGTPFRPGRKLGLPPLPRGALASFN